MSRPSTAESTPAKPTNQRPTTPPPHFASPKVGLKRPTSGVGFNKQAPPSTPRDTRKTVTPKGTDESITVAVRVRCFTNEEHRELAIRMKNNTCEIHIPSRGRFPFSFDRCLWSNDMEDCSMPYSSQADVFEAVGKPLVDNALAGFNSSIIAYGQTGSGKTYSIFGPPNSLGTENEGLIPRVCNAILERVRNPPIGVMHKLFVSISEIYLEDVFDLLHNRKKLSVRGSSQAGFSVCGLRSVPVEEYSEVLKLLSVAETHKTFAATAIHDRSSRAHTLFQLELKTITELNTQTSKVVLADLAGSERIKIAKTDAGIPLEQACNINLSLLSLGTCIEAVVNRTKNGQSTQNIGEFRNSTLTKLLKDFIGGNSKTAMLVAVAPGVQDVQTSLQALRFADRAKQLQSHAVINTEVNDDSHKVAEEISRMFDKKRELLDKECELEMMQSMLKKKQTDIEKQTFELMQEKRRLTEAPKAKDADEASRQKKRQEEIEQKLYQLQRELADAEAQRDALDERFLDMCAEHALTVQDKEQLCQDRAQLLSEIETLKQEHADEMMLNEIEAKSTAEQHEHHVQEIEENYHRVLQRQQTNFEEMSLAAEEKLQEANRLHEQEMSDVRCKIMSLEEDLAMAKRAAVDEAKDSKKLQLQMEGQLASKEKAFQQLQNDFTILKEEKEKAAQEQALTNERMKNQLHDTLSKLDRMEHEKENVEKELRGSMQKCEDLETNAQEMMKELETVETQNTNLQEQLVSERQVITKEKGEKTSLLEKLDAHIKTSAGRIQDLQQDIKASQDSANEKIQSWKKKYEEKHASHQAAETQLKEKENALLSQCKQKTDLINQHKVELAELRTQHEEVIQEMQTVHRRKFLSLKNENDLFYQQILSAHRALSFAVQSREEGDYGNQSHCASELRACSPIGLKHTSPLSEQRRNLPIG